MFTTVLSMLAATTSNAKAACQPFTVYAKDTLGSNALPKDHRGRMETLLLPMGLLRDALRKRSTNRQVLLCFQ